MKNIIYISILFAGILASCNGVKRKPGATYMPDMAYSRAYETYADHSNLAEQGINYTNLPVAGTVARGESISFSLPKDLPGDSTNYVAAKQVPNPLPPLNAAQMKEAERQYLINCGICHGPKLDGNGPLYKDGSGPYPAKPADLAAGAQYIAMPDGQMFYSITYGKNLMGPYGSQLSTDQRWAIIHYIKSKQGKGATAPADSTATVAPPAKETAAAASN